MWQFVLFIVLIIICIPLYLIGIGVIIESINDIIDKEEKGVKDGKKD